MFFALGAASSAIDALKALTSSKSSSAQTTGVARTPRARSICCPRVRRLRPARARLRIRRRRFADFAGDHERAARRAEPVLDRVGDRHPRAAPAALKDLFSQIDGDGDGKISKSEFENALGAGGTNLAQADSVFGKLDKDGDGSVSLEELASALKGGKGHHHRCMPASSSGDDGSNSDPFSQALQGASSTSVTNSDGSVTTSLTYADGSKVTMTSAASGSSSSAATSSYNFIEQMIQRQAQAISSARHRIALGQRLNTRPGEIPSDGTGTLPDSSSRSDRSTPVAHPERVARSHCGRRARSRGRPCWRRPCRVR